MLALLALLVWVVATVAMSHVAARGGDGAPLYSTRRYDPYGAAAAMETLRRVGVEARPLDTPRLWDAGVAGGDVIVQVLPATPAVEGWGDVSGLPVDKLAAFVLEGGTVVQFTSRRTALMRELGVGVWPRWSRWFGVGSGRSGSTPDRPPARWVEAEGLMRAGTPPGELGLRPRRVVIERGASGVPSGALELLEPTTFPVVLMPSGWTTLAAGWDERGRPVGVAVGVLRHGAGRLVVVGSPSPVLNGQLAEADHAAWLATLVTLDGGVDGAAAGGRVVWFDDWSHGVGHGGTVAKFLRRVGLMPAVLQVLIVVGWYVWSTMGRRRDAAPPPARRSSSVEQIAMLGQLYGQSLDAVGTVRRAGAVVRRRLARAMRCAVSDVDRRAASLPGGVGERAVALLADAPGAGPLTEPRCPSCRYRLRHHQGDRCPECGQRLDRALREHIAAFDAGSTAPTFQTPEAAADFAADLLARADTLIQDLTTT